ncbi:hypothetical protein A2U01_0006618 [Trifolium medium]|uniref:Uncharacterized protein n=1 Tax=Trifolium medium TaxID=97028 RepID=A0A392MG83_9FABA|nr:hypothetical protein [Trifolium medium]
MVLQPHPCSTVTLADTSSVPINVDEKMSLKVQKEGKRKSGKEILHISTNLLPAKPPDISLLTLPEAFVGRTMTKKTNRVSSISIDASDAIFCSHVEVVNQVSGTEDGAVVNDEVEKISVPLIGDLTRARYDHEENDEPNITIPNCKHGAIGCVSHLDAPM